MKVLLGCNKKGALLASKGWPQKCVSPLPRKARGLALTRNTMEGQYYVDKCLPFGLRFAPFLFKMAADVLEWILEPLSLSSAILLPLLRWFLFAGASQPDACVVTLMDMIHLAMWGGWSPYKTRKVVGPTTCLPLLGIVLDTVRKLINDK